MSRSDSGSSCSVRRPRAWSRSRSQARRSAGSRSAFFLLFSLLAVWTLLGALESPSFPRWLAYSLSVAALGYSHDLALLSVLAHPLLLVAPRGPLARLRAQPRSGGGDTYPAGVPALCLLLSLALALLRPKLALAGALLVGAAFLAVSLHDATRKQKEDWPGAAAYIATRTAAAEPIAIPGESSSNANGLLYYWSGLLMTRGALSSSKAISPPLRCRSCRSIPGAKLPICPRSHVVGRGSGSSRPASFPLRTGRHRSLSLRLQCVGSAGLQRRAGRPRHGVPPLMADQDRRPRGANVLRCGPPGRA
jgi:hypothetical protein